MATAVERATPALESQELSHIRRRRNSVEVIDVDRLSPLVDRPQHRRQATAGPSSRLFAPTVEVISLVDSDDEEPIVVSSTTRSSGAREQDKLLWPEQKLTYAWVLPFISFLIGPRMRLTSPPPPRQSRQPPPPVPRMSRAYAPYSSLPMRRRPPFPPAGVIRATEDPMPYERVIEHYRQPINEDTGPAGQADELGPLEPARPSHHLPVMGLGGALLATRLPASTRRNTEDTLMRHARHDNAAHRRRHLRMFDPAAFRSFSMENEDQDRIDVRLYAHDGFDFERYRDYEWIEQERQKLKEKETYHPSFTHPGEPEPGFTFDFAPPASSDDRSTSRLFPPTSIHNPIILDDDDDDVPVKSEQSAQSGGSATPAASSNGKLNSLLVCAGCTAPLLLNAAMDSAQAKDRRVWALRCGHLIDEKCLSEIAQPSDFFLQADGRIDKKGKGKATGAVRHVVLQPYATTLAVGGEPDDDGEEIPIPPEPTSIRTRLRTRPSTSSSAAQPSPAKKRRVTKKAVPKLEARHEWTCPVPNCGQVHASIKVDGVWGPEKDTIVGKGANQTKKPGMGAIPIFA